MDDRRQTTDDRRPPVGPAWRLAVFILATAIGVLGLRLILSPLSGTLGNITGIPFPTYAFIWTLVGGLLIGHLWTFRLVERRAWAYVGLGRQAMRPGAIAVGALLGALAIGVPSILLLAMGWLRMEPAASGNSLGEAIGSLAILVPASLWEELLMRGFFFAVLREAWGAARAIVASSTLFGLLHLENAGATAQSVALVALAGMFLGAILVATGSLYAAWAAHLSWNFVLAAVLHTAVSGVGMAAPDYRVVDAGPDWATGGAWGPEGGLFAAIGMAAALLVLFRRRPGRGAMVS